MTEKLKKFFIMPIQRIILYIFDFCLKFKKSKNVVFVIGVDEIANNTLLLKNILKNTAISVNLSKNKFYKNNKYDYSLMLKSNFLQKISRIIYGPYLLAKLSNQAEVFIYFWRTGFCIDRELDYQFLKNKHRKIVCIFVGTDIRSGYLTQQYYKEKNLDHFVNYTNASFQEHELRVKRTAYLADQYANLIFSPRKVQISYLKSKNIVDFFMYMIKDDFLNPNFTLNEKIQILHAPSNPIIKGTSLVRAAIKKLEMEGYEFEYIELINRSNDEVLKLLDQVDIVLNQFYAEMPGLFGIEAMAKSNAVLMSPSYQNLPNGAENAWVETKYWEIYDNLKYLLDNPTKIQEYAQNGYEFVKNNYTEEKVKNFYLDIFYEHGIISGKNIF